MSISLKEKIGSLLKAKSYDALAALKTPIGGKPTLYLTALEDTKAKAFKAFYDQLEILVLDKDLEDAAPGKAELTGAVLRLAGNEEENWVEIKGKAANAAYTFSTYTMNGKFGISLKGWKAGEEVSRTATVLERGDKFKFDKALGKKGLWVEAEAKAAADPMAVMLNAVTALGSRLEKMEAMANA